MSTSTNPSYSRGATPTPSRPTSSLESAHPMHSGDHLCSAGPARAAGTQSVNLQLPLPPVPAKRDGAFQMATQEYVKKLSGDDKAAFLSAPDVIECLQEIQCNGKSLISSSLSSRVEKVLQCVKHFMGSLGIFIQQSPEISSLVVGGVNCVLMVGIPCKKYFIITC